MFKPSTEEKGPVVFVGLYTHPSVDTVYPPQILFIVIIDWVNRSDTLVFQSFAINCTQISPI